MLYFAWINPYGIAVLAICIYYFPLFWRMDRHIRRLFFLSAFIYLTGAVGCEMLGGRFFELNRKQPHLVYEIVVACEELLEMCGLILLTYTLLMLMQRRCGGIAIVVAGDGTTAAATNHSDPN